MCASGITIRRWLARVVLYGIVCAPWAMIIVLLAQLGAIEHKREFSGLSYENFVATFGRSPIDPVGCTTIDVWHSGGIDVKHSYYRIAISESAFRDCLNQFDAKMMAGDPSVAFPAPTGRVSRFQDPRPAVPGYWPEPEDPPDWWEEAIQVDSSEVVRWEYESKNHAKGCLWMYRAGKLYVWDWTEQHRRLRE